MTAAKQTEVAEIAHRYVVLDEIARGGMGVVRKVRDRGTDTVRAMKQMLAGASPHAAAMRAAFEREYQVLASIDHPGIIRVFEFGIDDGRPYYTMEYVQGSDLRDTAPTEWRSACRQLRDVASALSLLHARRLLHRDLSPSNVKVNAQGRCKLLDFGALADFGHSSWVIGTPPLVPPEALAGDMLDQRADLYALGALGYWLLTGRHAYPASRIDDLTAAWRRAPPLPSAIVPSIPGDLDALIMSLLSANPLARPPNAAAVIAHLEGVAELAPDEERERLRLANSYLAQPPFIGRVAQMSLVSARLAATVAGRGGVLTIRGPAGSGRSRLLEESGVCAQVAGTTVLRVDASTHAGNHGAIRALVQHVFAALPTVAQRCAADCGLPSLGNVRERGERISSQIDDLLRAANEEMLVAWFAAVSRAKPLLIQIDNSEYVDNASLGVLLALADVARRGQLLLILVERSDTTEAPALGLLTLRAQAAVVDLPNFSLSETLLHVRSLFGDAPNTERFAEWLHRIAEGNPLACVALARQLVEREVIRYAGGTWALPTSQPAGELSSALDSLLAARIAHLSPRALSLARCIGLQRVDATFTLCVLASEERDEQVVRTLLDELARSDVLLFEQGVYRFSSTALRCVLLASMSDPDRALTHRRLGRALQQLDRADPILQIEAGWHLIQGGEDLEGADIIRVLMTDSALVRRLHADMYALAPPAEAALRVLKQHGRGPLARLPLLSALAQAGFNEDARYDVLYADEALDLCEEVAGMKLARRLRFLGRLLGLGVAMLVVLVRRAATPKRDRAGSFLDMMVHVFGTVLSCVAVAAMKLDGDRAARVANVLEPLSVLPRMMTGSALHRFCLALQEIARERQATAFAAFDAFAMQLANPRFFRLIPSDARIHFVSSAHFARGAFAIFRDDGRAALASADVLAGSGLRLWSMIGSQIRYLYYANRGELVLAAPHRAQVERHAAHFGSAWQVELWENAARLPLEIALDDRTAVLSTQRRLAEQAATIPSLRRYAHLSQLVAETLRVAQIPKLLASAEHEVEVAEPRSFVGWTTVVATIARHHNLLGQHAAARAYCDRALSLMTDADREYTYLFLCVDLEAAWSDCMLGHTALAYARIDGLLARFRSSDNPLTLGRLHEVRARIAWHQGDSAAYRASLSEVERWYRGTETPALIAKLERLADLSRPPTREPARSRREGDEGQTSDMTEATELVVPRVRCAPE